MTTGERIKELRNLHGYRQSDLAKMVGCTAQVISNIERGESRAPIELASKIATVFCVQIEDIMTDIPDGKIILSKDEIALIRNYRKLLSGDRDLLNGIVQMMVGRANKA